MICRFLSAGAPGTGDWAARARQNLHCAPRRRRRRTGSGLSLAVEAKATVREWKTVPDVTTERQRVRRGSRSLGNRRLNDLRRTPDDDNAVRSQRGHNSDITGAGEMRRRPGRALCHRRSTAPPPINHSPTDKELPKLDSFMEGNAAVESVPLAVNWGRVGTIDALPPMRAV